ncbi:MAG TPA: helix-turn-helix domain-containing protein [Chitinophaga sp.]
MEAILERTTKKDQQIAKSSITEMHKTSQKVLTADSDFVLIRVQHGGESLKIPKKALFLLFNILDNMAEGKSITLLPSTEEITTQQAADLLNVSRPHLVSLLEKGELPFKKVGTHRRIKLNDLIAYDEKLKKNRSGQLDLLAKQAQALNLGY